MDDYNKAVEDLSTEVSFGYLSDHCNDWNTFCNYVGLNPWLLNEGLADRDDLYRVTIDTLKKFGILR